MRRLVFLRTEEPPASEDNLAESVTKVRMSLVVCFLQTYFVTALPVALLASFTPTAVFSPAFSV